MIEYAILERGEIINVVSTDSRARAQGVADQMIGDDLTVALLESLPLDVKRRYRFWDERP